VPDQRDQQVACLLEAKVRAQIWRGLQAGDDPKSLLGLAEGAPVAGPKAKR
jgi:hypothetical protein